MDGSPPPSPDPALRERVALRRSLRACGTLGSVAGWAAPGLVRGRPPRPPHVRAAARGER